MKVIDRFSTTQIFLTCFAILIFFFILGAFLESTGRIPDEYSGLLFFIGWFICGLCGIPMIIRREIPSGVFNIKGIIAILVGVSFIVSQSIMGLIAIIMLIFKIKIIS